MPVSRAFLAVGAPLARVSRGLTHGRGGALVRPPRDAADLDRLRRRLGVVLAGALRAPGRRRRDGWAGARRRGARGGGRHGALGHVPAQARRNAVRPGRSGAHREAGRRALRLRRGGLRLPDAPDRAERALGGVAPDAAHADRRALPRERSPVRDAAPRARRPARRCSCRASRSRGAMPRRGGSRSAAVSDLVLENYANANLIWREGPVDGSRRLRDAPSPVRGEAARARDPADADRDHDRVPDRPGSGRPRGASADARAGSASRSGTPSP